MYSQIKKKAWEKTLSCYHFDLSRSISKLSSKLSAEDLFSVCHPELASGNHPRTSDTSSMKGTLRVAPGAATTTINYADNLTTKSTSKVLPLEPHKASEKAQLVDCVGDWSGSEEHWYAEPINIENLDSINLDDFELKLHSSSHLYMKSNGRSKPALPNTISPPNLGWNPRCNSWSTIESNDTIESSSSYSQSRTFSSLDDLTAASCGANEVENTVASKLPLSLRNCLLGDNSAETEQELLEDDDRGSCISASVSTSQQSIWLSDYSESVAVLGEDHPFQLIKPTVVLTALLAYRDWQCRPTEASGNVTAKDSSTNAGGAGRGQFNTSSGKKRNRDQGGGSEEENENNDGDKAPEKKSRTSKKASGHQASLACPFVKKDPVTYRSCYTYELKRIQDVKQHLSRRHQLPIYCPRCMDIFDAENKRDEHIRQSNCLLQEPIPFEGVTRTQKEQLTQRVSPKMTLEAQWFTIFEILFPGHRPRPKSAYINAELSVDLEGFQDFMHCRGPAIILERLRLDGILPPSMENEEHDLHAFLKSVIVDSLQMIIQRWLATRISEDTTLMTDASLVPSCNGHSQPSATSSSTLHEQYCEGELMNQLQAKNEELDELDQDEKDQLFQDQLQTPVAAQKNMTLKTTPMGSEQNSELPSGESIPESQQGTNFDDTDSWKNYYPQNWFESSNASY